VDLGTTYTAAAVFRAGQVTMAELGTRSPVAPSIVLARPDGTVLFGEAAERRALLEPVHVAREFKRRMGDPVPVLLGGVPHSPESLGARLLAWVVARVSEAEGAAPATVAVTHPANWGPYKQAVLGQLLELAGRPDAIRLTEPEAAAIAHAADARVPPEAHLAVYDLGGGTFDTVVLRHRDDRFAIVGEPSGIEHLGGVDFDEALFRWVWDRSAERSVGLDTDDDLLHRDLLALRRECVTAKEALSADQDVVVAVRVGPVQRDITVTRHEFADLIRPTLSATTDALGRVIEDAGLTPDQLHGVLLVGGSSRIPLVTELIEAELDRPVVLDVHPKHIVARGAALVAGAALPSVAAPARSLLATNLPGADGPPPPPTPPPPAPGRPGLGAPAPGLPASPTVPLPTVSAGPAPVPASAAPHPLPANLTVPLPTPAAQPQTPPTSPPAPPPPVAPAAEPPGPPPAERASEPSVPPRPPAARVRPTLVVVVVVVAGLAVGAWLARGREDDTGGTTTTSSASTVVSSATAAGPDQVGLAAYDAWITFMLRAFDQILDAMGQPAGAGAASCTQALAEATGRFGAVEDRAGLQLPGRLADDISGITKVPVRDAMLQAIGARTQVLQLCAAGDYRAALEVEDRLNDLDAAVVDAKQR
jgi:actin-like ATPase involved in cell morphogenesis